MSQLIDELIAEGFVEPAVTRCSSHEKDTMWSSWSHHEIEVVARDPSGRCVCVTEEWTTDNGRVGARKRTMTEISSADYEQKLKSSIPRPQPNSS